MRSSALKYKCGGLSALHSTKAIWKSIVFFFSGIRNYGAKVITTGTALMILTDGAGGFSVDYR